jgi:hypothetical protein
LWWCKNVLHAGRAESDIGYKEVAAKVDAYYAGQ